MRVCWRTVQWEEAAKAAEAARTGYALMTTTAEYEGFNNISNKEWIWGFPQIPSQSDASYNFYYLDATYVGAYSSFMADPHLKDTFIEGDIRLPLFQWMREGYLGYKKFHMRAGRVVLKLFSKFRGAIQTDGYERYDLLDAKKGI